MKKCHLLSVLSNQLLSEIGKLAVDLMYNKGKLCSAYADYREL